MVKYGTNTARHVSCTPKKYPLMYWTTLTYGLDGYNYFANHVLPKKGACGF